MWLKDLDCYMAVDIPKGAGGQLSTEAFEKLCRRLGDRRLKAIGWLTRDREYPSGPTSPEVFEKLCQLLVDPWSNWVYAGWHRCELCPPLGESPTSDVNTQFHPTSDHSCNSSHELFVPGDGCLYISPLTITHYINDHWYAPPQEFRDAVLHCPEMGTVAYREAVQAIVQKLDNLEWRVRLGGRLTFGD